RCRSCRIPPGVSDRRRHQLRGGDPRAHCDQAAFGAAGSWCGGVAAPDSATQRRRAEPAAPRKVRTFNSTRLKSRIGGGKLVWGSLVNTRNGWFRTVQIAFMDRLPPLAETRFYS